MHTIRCQLVGAGGNGDPFRAPFPTYRTIDVDPVARTIIIEVPDETVTDGFEPGAVNDFRDVNVEIGRRPHPTLPNVTIPVLQNVRCRVRLQQGETARWHRLLDDRYVEHAGEYRPELQ